MLTLQTHIFHDASLFHDVSGLFRDTNPSTLTGPFSPLQAQMLSQYEKFQDFVNANPKFKEKKMKKFISHFENTEGDLNLDALYNAVTGENTAGDPLLDTVVTTERRNRRNVEDFCARLKKLFVVGIIAVMGHAALTEKAVDEELVEKWQRRMEDVETRMKVAVDDCTNNFAVQVREDFTKSRVCNKTLDGTC